MEDHYRGRSDVFPPPGMRFREVGNYLVCCWSGRMGWSSIPFGSGFDLLSTSWLEKGSNDDNDDYDEKEDEWQN